MVIGNSENRDLQLPKVELSGNVKRLEDEILSVKSGKGDYDPFVKRKTSY